MRALLFGTYDTSLHPRIATIAEGLRAWTRRPEWTCWRTRGELQPW
jgi:hypothetical protein